MTHVKVKPLCRLVFLIMMMGLSVGLVVPASAYTTWQTRTQMVNSYFQLQTQYPQYVSIQAIGQSVQNRTIYMVAIGNASVPMNQTILITSALHGIEYVGTEAMWSVMKWLLSQSESVCTAILANNLILNIFIVNVDNYKYSQWNKHGVNLNRNFDAFWGYWETARSFNIGKSPLSEPETQAVHTMMSLSPAWYIDVHTGGSRITPCWNVSGKVPEHLFYHDDIYAHYKTLCYQRKVTPISYWENTVTGIRDEGGEAVLDAYWNHGSHSLLVECSTNQRPSYSALSGITNKLKPFLIVVCQETWN